MSLFVQFNPDDGAYALTTAGMIAVIVIMALLLLLVAFLRARRENTDGTVEISGRSVFSTRQLVFSAVGLALAFALSYVKLFRFPWGGSITLCSMLFVVLIGYWYGLRIGLITAFIYGCLQFLQGGGSYILSPLQAFLDYFGAFTALGLAGLFTQKKNGLIPGYLIAIVIRGALHALGGYLYWMAYMPDEFPQSLAAVYPIVYNYAYILGEGVLTIIILLLPPVKKALSYVRKMALA